MEKLIEQLIDERYLKSPEIIEAFSRIDRADFIRPTYQDEAYNNYPLQIGFNQTISQPATVAYMLELLKVKKGDKVLDIGSGSGWQTALLACLTGHTGFIYAIERINELAKFGEANCRKYNFDNIKFITGDGSHGLPEEAPFDKIIVAAAADSLPAGLKEQLTIGGRLVIPVGEGTQDLVLIKRQSRNIYQTDKHPGFIFVPLVSR